MVYAVIPFRPKNPKTRLSCILSQEERENFAVCMLNDVIKITNSAGLNTVLLSTEEFEVEDAETVVMALGLNEALNEFLSGKNEPVLIIMSDIPLADYDSVKRVISTDCDFAIVPGRGGGTNAIFVKNPSYFHVDFYGASFLDHIRIAKELGMSIDVIDSFRLSTDIDEREDLVEIILHGKGLSRNYLEKKGVLLSVEKGRVGIKRKTDDFE
ncbi:2-phospho-L-lactate guanylyltransferase [Methanoplanus sp. FWC-SCC4]|uniref:2-phospho-L-lactate guanylyltransferase n=1 Tax=Methanochimaera problematica TaxID=2609417 RepID=A0AA97FCV6_9EURY|nr:2-phospho-L-lactate guanylyltransferase [Methanoplanus sp. FWC-SCC4]WOF16542.1 2-phospho-L-lactate guanylyltransferase [Methanoplanus sp. FWC-SCC4]